MKPARIPSQFYIIHLALTLSPAMFAAAIYFILHSEASPVALPADQSVLFQSVAAALAVIAVGFSQLLPRFMLRDERHTPPRKYFTMKIVQWAMLEGAAFFIGAIYFLSQHQNLLIPIGVLIALIALMRPTTDEIERYHVSEDT